MKNFFYYLSAFLLVASYGCNDDEMDAPATVAGTWTIDKYEIITSISGGGETSTVTYNINAVNGSELLLTFNESPNTYTIEGDAEVTTETADADGNTTTEIGGLEDAGSGTWTRNGDEIILVDAEAEETSLTIVELTPTLLRTDAGGEFTLDLFGAQIDYSVSGEINMSR